MRNLTSILSFIIFTVILSSCSASYDAAAYEDDAFYNPYREKSLKKKEQKLEKKLAKTRESSKSYNDITNSPKPTVSETTPETSKVYTDENGDYYIMDDDSLSEDYYDYEYTQRIKKFHSDNYNGKSYYDNSYYDEEPYGGNIYVNNMYNPFYGGMNYGISYTFGYGWGLNFGFGYPSYGWGYPSYGWGYPYYGNPYYGGGAYYAGYNDGYWNGYYNGGGYWGDDNYYGSNSYYGHRGGSSTNGSTGNRSNSISSDMLPDHRTKGIIQNNPTTKTKKASNYSSKLVRQNSNTSKKNIGLSSSTRSNTSFKGEIPNSIKAANNSAISRKSAAAVGTMGQKRSSVSSKKVVPANVSTRNTGYSSKARTNPAYRKTYSKPRYYQSRHKVSSYTTSDSRSSANVKKSYNHNINTRGYTPSRSNSRNSYSPSKYKISPRSTPSSSRTRSYTPARSSSSSSRSSSSYTPSRSSSSSSHSSSRSSSSSSSTRSSSSSPRPGRR